LPTNRATRNSCRTRSRLWGASQPRNRDSCRKPTSPARCWEHALTAEKQAIADYGKRIRQAEAFGDIGLKVGLENQVADETRHKEEIERILVGWNELYLERARNEDRWRDDGGQG
jgi:bacterioferritin (cytochrome b1)